jgi:hypothetical protein
MDSNAMPSLLETAATPAPPSTIPPTTATPGTSPPIPPAPATAMPATTTPATTTPATATPATTTPATNTAPATNAPTTAVIGGGSADNPIDVDKQPLRKNAFESTKVDRALEWSAILLEQHKPEKGGKEKVKPSKVYGHFYRVFLNSEVVSYTYFFTCEFLFCHHYY